MRRINGQEDGPPASNPDKSSDCSSDSSCDPPQTFEEHELRSGFQITIMTLCLLCRKVPQPTTEHRKQPIRPFKGLERNMEAYQTFERCARQKVDHLFPTSSEVLRERMAESIATRRMRFMQFEQRQKTLSTLNEPAPIPQRRPDFITSSISLSERFLNTIPIDALPRRPQLDPTDTSFACQYCCLVCPA